MRVGGPKPTVNIMFQYVAVLDVEDVVGLSGGGDVVRVFASKFGRRSGVKRWMNVLSPTLWRGPPVSFR